MTTPPPPDRAQSNESAPQWMLKALDEIRGQIFLGSYEETNLAMAAILARHVPPVSQRATGEELLIDHHEALDLAGEALEEINGWSGNPSQNMPRKAALAAFIRSKFSLLATPRSLPHGPGVKSGLRGKVILLGEITYDDFGTMRTHPGAIIQCTVEQIQQARGNLIYREVELTDVPAVEGSATESPTRAELLEQIRQLHHQKNALIAEAQRKTDIPA